MAIKAGNLIHTGNGGVLLQRIQTGGPGQLNIPKTKIYELGNYRAVGTVFDTPDLSFTLDTTDVSTDIEEWLTRSYGGRTVAASGAITATDFAIVITGGALTQADVDRGIIVEGAGAGGADLVTTIATVTDATHATTTDAAGTTVAAAGVTIYAGYIDLATCVPVDVGGQFKAGINDPTDPFAVIASAAIPFLYLESMSYNFGLHDNNSMQASLRGDSIFYSAGSVYIEETAGTGATGQAIVTAQAAMLYDGDGNTRRVLAVEAGIERLTLGVDYTESYGSITDDAAITTITLVAAVPTDQYVRIVYASLDEKEYPQSVHQADLTILPAAVRGRDVEVYVGGYDPNDVEGSQANKWTTVQSVKIDWKVTLDKDEEFGNAFATGQDFDVPDVSGTITIKPRNPADFFTKLRQTAGVTDVNKVLGADVTVPLALDVVVRNPTTKAVAKRIHVPDARFTLPGYSGKVQTKVTVDVTFDSDAGTLQVANL
jgi:hypothetical protein